MEDMMNHQEAVDKQLAEQYILGELTASERERFEAHFFECMECAGDVQAGAVFAENAREVLRADAVRPVALSRGRKPFGFLASLGFGRAAWAVPALAAVLLSIVGYQRMVVIPGLQRQIAEVRALPSYPLLAAARGAGSVIRVSQDAPYVILYFDVPRGGKEAGYFCRLLSEDGQEKWSGLAPEPLPGRPVMLLVPTSRVQAGSYRLLVEGRDPSGSALGDSSEFHFRFEYN